MNALELFLLGRKLTKLGEEAMPQPGGDQIPLSNRAILLDIFEHPGTTVSNIVARTGLTQSQVSASVAHFRDLGACYVETDPADRRRTLVSGTKEFALMARQRASVPIDDTIAKALDIPTPEELSKVLAAIDTLAHQLIPRALSWTRSREEPE